MRGGNRVDDRRRFQRILVVAWGVSFCPQSKASSYAAQRTRMADTSRFASR